MEPSTKNFDALSGSKLILFNIKTYSFNAGVGNYLRRMSQNYNLENFPVKKNGFFI